VGQQQRVVVGETESDADDRDERGVTHETGSTVARIG
jgi:hypothetical protein